MSAPPSSSPANAGGGPARRSLTIPSNQGRVLLDLVGFLDPDVGNVPGDDSDGGSASSAEGAGGLASSAEVAGDGSGGGSASSSKGSDDESDNESDDSSKGSDDESDSESDDSSQGFDDESDGFSLEEGDGNFTIRFHRRSAESMESSAEEEEEDFLCTLICDLLAGLPRTSNQCWDEGICRRVSAGLRSCDGHGKNIQENPGESSGNDIEDASETDDAEHSSTIDIRGRYVDDAKGEMMMHLVRCSRISDLRYLKVIVGCKVHGVGKGKLMQSIIDLLERDDTIEWKKENGGSVISIKLDGEKDYSSLGWDVNEKIQPFEQDEEIEKEEALSQVVADAQEKDFLCTFICDFVFGIPKVNTCWDSKMCKRIATASLNCDRAEFERQKQYYDRDNTATFDIRGQFVLDALNIFKSQLYSYSGMSSPISSIRYVNVIVGCKVHGLGEGKLKQAIVDVLEKEDDLKWKEEYGGAVLCIKLDGRQCFNFLGEDFVHPRFDFGMDISDNSEEGDESHDDDSGDDSHSGSGSD